MMYCSLFKKKGKIFMYISRELETKIKEKLSEVSDLVTQLSEQSKETTPEFQAFLDGQVAIRIENEDQYKKFVDYLEQSGVELLNRNENFEPFYDNPTKFDYNYRYYYMQRSNDKNLYFLDAYMSLKPLQQGNPQIERFVFLSDVLHGEKNNTLFTSPDMTKFLNGNLAIHVENEKEYQELLNALAMNHVKMDDEISKFNPEVPYIKIDYNKDTQNYSISRISEQFFDILKTDMAVIEFKDANLKRPDAAILYDMDNMLKQAQKQFDGYTDEQKQKYSSFNELLMSGRQLVNEFKERDNIEKEEQRENGTGPVLENPELF